MVARNLERGSGFSRPQLDTAPFPNYFLVEPPLYQSGALLLRRAAGMPLESAGRILSALMTALGGWGLYALLQRQSGRRVALFALTAFAFFPLTIRYGRAFQPDAAMLGAVLAGSACWDRHETDPRARWLAAGWCLLAAGFAFKIISAIVLVPLAALPSRRGRALMLALASSALVPVLLWYAWADQLIAGSAGSRAAGDNRSIWMGLVGISGMMQAETLKVASWSLFVRAFTPVGAALAILGFCIRRDPDSRREWFWPVWGLSALIALALMGAKLHHEYYWLLLAPPAAAGIGLALDRLCAHGGLSAPATTAALVLLCVVLARSTWRTPPEWTGIDLAGRVVAATVPRDCWIAAPEALLYQADRRGCRMEWTAAGASRAAGEWGGERDVASPLELIEFYRQRGARYFADLGDRAAGPHRKGLHDSVRRRYKVIVDLPEIIIADLADAGMRSYADRSSARNHPRLHGVEVTGTPHFHPDRLRLSDGTAARRRGCRLPLGRRLAWNGDSGLGNHAPRHARPDHIPCRNGFARGAARARCRRLAVSKLSSLAEAGAAIGGAAAQGDELPGGEARRGP
jgi:hypothetical protein